MEAITEDDLATLKHKIKLFNKLQHTKMSITDCTCHSASVERGNFKCGSFSPDTSDCDNRLERDFDGEVVCIKYTCSRSKNI